MKVYDMRLRGLWPLLVAPLVVLPASAEEETICESATVSIALDARADGVLAPSSRSDILPFAYNSDANWIRNGNAKQEATVSVQAMYCLEDAAPEFWSDVGSDLSEDVLIQSSGEGTVAWSPLCQSLYRASLTVGGNVVSEAYFNLTETEGVPCVTALTTAVVTLPADEVHKTGEPLTFESIDVMLGGQQLVEGVDYVVRYADNVDVGTATVTVHGIWRYGGTAVATFAIVDVRKQMDTTASVTLSSGTVTYSGDPCRPAEIVVKDGDETLVEGVDYRLEYENNVLLGTGVIHVIGIGSRYVGDKVVTFEIVPSEAAEIADASGNCRLGVDKNDVLTVRGVENLLPFVWNTSEAFDSYGSCVWTIGGLSEKDQAEATVAIAPIASPTAEPDPEAWTVLKVAAGEGAVTWKPEHGGYHKAKLTITKKGVPVAGELTRVIRLRNFSGLVIFVQ